MEPTAILATLEQLGITTEANGDKLVMVPGSKVPPELVAEVRQHKSEIMALLSRKECAKSPFQSNALTDGLLSRLQTGSCWLTDQHLSWLEGNPDAVSDARFSTALDAWVEMERSLRMVFGYKSCVCGLDLRCPEYSPVICDFYVDAS
jgi:hypothetical protein